VVQGLSDVMLYMTPGLKRQVTARDSNVLHCTDFKVTVEQHNTCTISDCVKTINNYAMSQKYDQCTRHSYTAVLPLDTMSKLPILI